MGDDFAARYPNITRFTKVSGSIEIGITEDYEAFVRMVDNSGNIWLGDAHYATMDDALSHTETALAAYFKDTVEVEDGPIPQELLSVYKEIVALTTSVCLKHLNQEYADLSRKAAHHLCQNRAARITSGKPKSWAAAIVYALGQVNYLTDSSLTPYMAMSELCGLFGVSQQTASTKAREIRELLDMYPLQPPWAVKSILEQTGMPWLVLMDGYPMDVRTLPREAQEAAFRQGLIPFLPDANLPEE